MPLATANGHTILEAAIHESLRGVWLAEVAVDDSSPLVGSVEIDLGSDVVFVGTATPGRSAVESGRSKARILGGAGAMGTVLPARAYQGVALGLVLEHILAATGEQIGADSATLASEIRPSWLRIEGKAARALDGVADAVGKTWRIQRDGTVLLVADTFPDLAVDHTRIDFAPTTNSMLIGPTAATLRPGVTFEGRRVTSTITRVAAGGLRQHLYFEEDRLHRVLGGIVGAFTKRQIDHSYSYPSTVVGQNADGTLELQPDDAVVGGRGGPGLSRVPIRYGVPGMTATVLAGARCRLAFDAGDQSRPFAFAFEPGSLDTITLTAATKITMAAPDVDLGTAAAAAVRFGDTVSVGASVGPITYTGLPGTESDVRV